MHRICFNLVFKEFTVTASTTERCKTFYAWTTLLLKTFFCLKTIRKQFFTNSYVCLLTLESNDNFQISFVLLTMVYLICPYSSSFNIFVVRFFILSNTSISDLHRSYGVERCYAGREYVRGFVRSSVRTSFTKCTIVYHEQTIRPRSANF